MDAFVGVLHAGRPNRRAPILSRTAQNHNERLELFSGSRLQTRPWGRSGAGRSLCKETLIIASALSAEAPRLRSGA